jgi:acetylornithine deacetylase/succinyl-diaminopimelate desuccinylase-like protein
LQSANAVVLPIFKGLFAMVNAPSILKPLLIALLTLCQTSAAFAQEMRPELLAQLEQDALNTLTALIRLDTSQPAGNEYLAANYLKQRLDAEGIASKLFEPEPGRTSIVARISGNGTKRPILLLGHTDVVTVEADQWSFNPFEGAVRNNRIFGRGAADDKGIVAASFEIMLALHRHRIHLDRDVIFLGVADEEGGGGLGITYLVDNHLDEINAEFAINEGGRGQIDPQTGKYVNFHISTAEKTPTRARLIVEGTAGHGSVPTRDNPIGVLSRAIARLFETPLPMQLNETTRAFFQRLAASRPDSEAKIYREILRPNPSLVIQEKLRDIKPAYYSMIRTSISPTIFEGGYQRNVIPTTASATLDIRALPGTDTQVLFADIASIINDPSVRIEPMAVTRPAHLPAPLDTELFHAFEQVLLEAHPDTVVLPSMLTGATDSAQLRAAGIPTYGFGPSLYIGEDNGIHGNDEFLPVAAFNEYLKLLWQVVNRVAATPQQ